MHRITDLNHDVHRKREFIRDAYSGKIHSKLQIDCFDDDTDYSEKKKKCNNQFLFTTYFIRNG